LDAEPNSSDKTPTGDEHPLPIAKAASAPLPVGAIQEAVPVVPQNEAAAQPAQQQPSTEIQISHQPLLVHITKDDELSVFEKKTVFFGGLGIFVAFLSLVAACAGGYFVFQQFEEMVVANNLADISARRARHDSAESSIATARQLAILQGQLTQQRNSMQIDQRPWLRFELGGDRPAGTDPHNAKDRTFPLNAGQPVKIPVRVTNVGKTAAEHLLATAIIEIVSRDKRPAIIPKKSLKFTEDGKPTPKGNSIPTTAWREGVLYPEEVSENSFSRVRRTKDGELEDDPLTKPEKDALDSRKSYILIFGEVWYSDIFGVAHWTKFCEMGNAQLNDVIGTQCIRFSAVDHNQPTEGGKNQKTSQDKAN
jgi:hypothetical protein